MYSIYFTNQARRLSKKLPQDVQDRIKRETSALDLNPLASEPLEGAYRSYQSLHLSHKGVAYQIIYQIISKASSIAIVLADKRENL
jgi:mRNA-degrading endonuclease RelE of RelBE toxin-antitoxin system